MTKAFSIVESCEHFSAVAAHASAYTSALMHSWHYPCSSWQPVSVAFPSLQVQAASLAPQLSTNNHRLVPQPVALQAIRAAIARPPGGAASR